MGLKWFEYLILMTALSPVLTLAFLLYYKNRLERRYFYFFAAVITITLLTDIISSILAFLFSINNLWVIHLNTFLMGFVMLYFFSSSKVGGTLQLLNKLLLVGLIVFTCIQWFLKSVLNDFQLTYIFVSFYSVNYSLHSLYKRVDYIETKSELFGIDFWIYCGILIYYGSTLFLTFFESTILSNHPTLFYSVWPIQWGATILFFSFLTFAIWTKRRT